MPHQRRSRRQQPTGPSPARLLTARLLAAALLIAPIAATATEAPAKETLCDDGIDNDGDGMIDCADADCFSEPACKPDGRPEDSDARCSDWIDNDADGAVDCDDSDCFAPHISVCRGSWGSPALPTAQAQSPMTPAADTPPGALSPQLTLPPGMSTVDLIGYGADVDGERNDYVCSDGIDNDGDGLIDCEDPGCMFDDSVTVCRGNPGLRFSVVGMIMHSYDIEEDVHDTRFYRLQLRAFGPIPQIQDSFFLISMLTERTPRMVFAMFQVPIARSRHQLVVNSGAAGLSQIQAISIHKQLFIERPNLFRAMEQFNSAAVEVTGPLRDDGKLLYRVFAAGGNGRFDGNIGGRTVADGDQNYPWMAGAQLGVNLVGFYSRFDTPFLYTPLPLTVGLLVGAKYDEREQERFASFNAHLAIRYNRIIFMAENYLKREMEFGQWANSHLVQFGVLAIPKHLMLAVEYGEFIAGDFEDPPEQLSGGLRNQRDERLVRAAAHWFFYRNIGVFSVVYADRTLLGQDLFEEVARRDVQGVMQFRF